MTDTTHLHEAIKVAIKRVQVTNDATLRDALYLIVGYLENADPETAAFVAKLLDDQ